MDQDGDGYLSREEFLFAVEFFHDEIGLCRNVNFWTYYLEDLYDPEFVNWDSSEDSAFDVLDELLKEKELRDYWFEEFGDVWSW